MTSTELPANPPITCPAWCDSAHCSGWEQRLDTGQLVRTPMLLVATSRPSRRMAAYRSLGVDGYATEYVDGTPMRFGISVEAPGVDVTAEQALEVANSLTVLAERI